MSRDEVATFLGKDKASLLRCLIDLSEAGIVRPINDEYIVVQPIDLAIALVRDAFFGDVPVHAGYRKLFHQSPWKPQALRVLIRAHAYGARIPYIEELLTHHATNENLIEPTQV